MKQTHENINLTKILRTKSTSFKILLSPATNFDSNRISDSSALQPIEMMTKSADAGKKKNGIQWDQ